MIPPHRKFGAQLLMPRADESRAKYRVLHRDLAACLQTGRANAPEEDSEAQEDQMTRRMDVARHYQQTHISISCDECGGRGDFAREICQKCGGLGKVVIPLPRESFYRRRPVLARFLILLAAVVLVILTSLAILP